MNNDKDLLIQYILEFTDTFDACNIEDYKTLVSIVYNNVAVFGEIDQETNQAVIRLLQTAYNKIDSSTKEHYDIREQIFSHKMKKWLERSK